jgi:hypothetical protein
MVPAGLVGYAAFLWHRFGDPLLFAHVQAHWMRRLADPFSTLHRAWDAATRGAGYFLDPAALFLSRHPHSEFVASGTLDLAFLALLVFLVAAGLLLLPPGLSGYALVATLIPVLTPFISKGPLGPLLSLPRFVLGVFPIFLVLGHLLSRSKAALWAWLLFSGGLGAALTALFVTWRWVA